MLIARSLKTSATVAHVLCRLMEKNGGQSDAD